jgi:hypothetical protein
MEVKIEIESFQYDMILEQKDLIMNIIDELIAENDAEQIAKSKLVFVPDVEEQIAPTKKTRAKKVVAPVVEVESDDLPDFIGEFPIIRTLPEPVRKLAGLRRKELHQNINNFNENDNLSTAFNWDKAPEGFDFWSKISEDGDLTEFKKLYGNKGEKVDELIEFAELNEFVEGLSKPSTSAPAPAVKTRKPRTPKVVPVVADKYTATAFEGKTIKHTLSDSTFSDEIELFVRENEKKGYEVYVDLYSKGKLSRQVYKTKKPVKVVTPKPTKVVTPKPVKVVAPKVVKTKVTKPKVEDDLSFLNDLDNIF